MEGNDDDSYRVELYVYDMSKGLVKTMSPALLGNCYLKFIHNLIFTYYIYPFNIIHILKNIRDFLNESHSGVFSDNTLTLSLLMAF